MAGNYRRLKNGKWELSVRMGTDLITGNRIRKYKYVEAQGVREVQKLLAEFITECEKGSYENTKMKVKDFIYLWMKDYVEKNLKKKTIVDYKEMLQKVELCLGHKRLNDLKPTHLIQFYSMLSSDGARSDGKPGGLSPVTVKHYHLVISSMLATAFRWGLVKENVAKRVKAPKVPKANKKPNVFTIEEIKEMIKCLEEEPLKYKLIVMIAIFTGFRRGEILGLEWADIDYLSGGITVNKTSVYHKEYGIYEDTTKTELSNRVCYVPKEIMNLFMEYYVEWSDKKEKCGDRWQETDRIFIQWNGRPIHPDTITKWFRKFTIRNDLPRVRFHGLRHTHGSILLDLKVPPAIISEQLGHADLQMLFQVYGHNVRKNSREVADFMGNELL
jgi:integrase